MTRAEIACRLIEAELSNPAKPFKLSNPRPLMWTTLPPPEFYTLMDNALCMAEYLLRHSKGVPEETMSYICPECNGIKDPEKQTCGSPACQSTFNEKKNK